MLSTGLPSATRMVVPWGVMITRSFLIGAGRADAAKLRFQMCFE